MKLNFKKGIILGGLLVFTAIVIAILAYNNIVPENDLGFLFAGFGIVVIGIIIGVNLLKHYISKKKSKKKIENPVDKQISSSPNEEKQNQRDFCPRCGAPLVKRHGRYGDFFGCQNYSLTGCKYTRKFK